MKRDFDLPFLDLNGEQVIDPKLEYQTKEVEGKKIVEPIEVGKLPRDIKYLSNIALNNTDTPETTPEQKAKKWALMQKTYKGGIVDLKSDEITFLKELAGKALSTIGYGRFVEFLEADYKAPIEKPAKK
jgi:hypothetical protein